MIDYNYRHRNNPRHIPYNSQSKDSKGLSTTMDILNERCPDNASTSLTNMYHLQQDHIYGNPSLRAPTNAIPIESPVTMRPVTMRPRNRRLFLESSRSGWSITCHHAPQE